MARWDYAQVAFIDDVYKRKRRQCVRKHAVKSEKCINGGLERTVWQILGNLLHCFRFEGEDGEGAESYFKDHCDRVANVHHQRKAFGRFHLFLDRGQVRMGHETEEDDAPGDREAFGIEERQGVEVPRAILGDAVANSGSEDKEKGKHAEHAQP